MSSAQTARSPARREETRITSVAPGYASGMGIPWWAKMTAKLVLSRLPVAYGIWKKLGLFQHGTVTVNFDRLQGGFEDHVNEFRARCDRDPATLLELGCGDSVGRALSAAAIGAQEITFVDIADFATRDSEHYLDFYNYMLSKNIDFKGVPADFSREEILKFGHGVYETNGLSSLRGLASSSIDLSFSDAVLEHVARAEFQDHMHELFRVHRPGTISRHWVDLHDHLGARLNNLRFPAWFWEGGLVHRSGFYTNRLQMQDMIDMAQYAGFITHVLEIRKWDELPTRKDKMDKQFVGKIDEIQNVCTFLIVLEKPA